MEKRTALLFVTIGMLMSISGVMAANWYYSTTVQTTSVDWLVTIDPIPAQTTKYTNVNLSGDVFLGSSAQSGVTVHVFLDVNSSGSWTDVGTAVTDGSGIWNFAYNNTETSGSTLDFRAGVFQ